MTKAFISYSSIDDRWAKRIAGVLARLGVDHFLDRKDIRWGDKVVEAISESMRSSSDVVVVISPASLKSQWVAFEIGQAKALGKRLLPLLTHASLDVPDFLRGFHYVSSLAELKRHFGEVASVAATARRQASGSPTSSSSPTPGLPEAALQVEPFFWLAQCLVAFAGSGMELSYAAFDAQARDLGVSVERDNLDVREYGIHAEPEFAAKIERLHGSLAAAIFEIGYLVSLLPFSFTSEEMLRRMCSTLEGATLKKLPAGLQAVARLTTGIPCEIEVFVKKVEDLKIELQRTAVENRPAQGSPTSR